MNNCLFVEMQLATRIGIHRRLFCGDNLVSKNFKKLFLMQSIFTGLWFTVRNSTKLCRGWFLESVLKYLHQTPWSIFRKSVYSGILDCRTKNFTADTGTCPEGKKCSKTSKIPKRPLQNVSFSINFAGLQTKVSDFSKYCNRLRQKKLL